MVGRKNHPFLDSGIETVRGPIQTKNTPPLWVGVLKNREKIHYGSILEKTVTTFRDIYGHGKPVDKSSWGEYLKCTNDQCKTTLSIENYYHLESYIHLVQLEQNGMPDHLLCPSCHAPIDIFWNPDVLLMEMRQQFTVKDIFAAFLYDALGNLYGFEYGWVDTVQSAWQEVIARLYRGMGLTYESYLEQLSQNSNRKLKEDTNVFHLVEVGQTVPSRNQETMFSLVGSFLNEAVRKDALRNMPAIAVSQRGIRSYVFLRVGGFKEACVEEHSDIVVLLASESAKNLGESLALPLQQYKRTYFHVIKNIYKDILGKGGGA